MSHYEERLAADLQEIRQRVEEVGRQVHQAHKNAIHALLTGDRALAYATILGDLPINREVRSIDRDCHAFAVRHLPTAGHLRYMSAAQRLIAELERIGDYAATICREAVQLSEAPVGAVARDLELMGQQSRGVLDQALVAWNTSNAELARGTIGMAKQATSASKKVFEDLLSEGKEDPRPLEHLFALLMVFNRLDRVVAQAKNICEETLFAVAGETKAPKRYRILFVDKSNDGLSQLAEAHARQTFPESGRYASAGWTPAESLEPRVQLFMERQGLDADDLAPKQLPKSHDELSDYHVIVSLGGDVRPHVDAVPFHTCVLEWDIGPSASGMDQERAEELLEQNYGRLADNIRDLIQLLRGEETS